ncbi:MAG TPA: M56 family metallopeptidase [Vicinamibacterales bacterium]|nr:M56 family metallopeptidase [Vicinamibacterales bacterium]
MAWWLFQNLVVTALVAGVVALVCRTTRVGPVVRHALWLLVLIKFVTPPVLVWPWSAPDPLGLAALDARQAAAIDLAAAGMPSVAGSAVSAIEPTAGFVEISTPAAPVARSTAGLAAAAWPWLIAIWIAGSVYVLMLETVRLARLARQIRRAVPGPPEVVARGRRLARDLGLRAVDVVAVEGPCSPAIWCVGRPRLLWPAALSAVDACLDGLLVHELAHVQRRDHLVGWIDLVAGVIWWWNPLFWYVRSALREQAELACDAWVISALPNGRRAYAESLLALSSAAGQRRSPALAAVIGIRANNRRVLERRLVMIMQGRAPLRLSIAGLVALAVFALATLPAWATGQQPATTAVLVPSAQQPATPVPVTPATQQPLPVVKPTVHVQQTAPVVVKPTNVPVVVTSGQAPTPVTVVHQVKPGNVPVIVSKPIVPLHPVTLRETMPAVVQGGMVHVLGGGALPADGQEMLKKFEADRDVIQQEADKKIEARRAEFVKQLQALQDQYTRAGKLDEAVAIRDYIKAGAGANHVTWIKR